MNLTVISSTNIGLLTRVAHVGRDRNGRLAQDRVADHAIGTVPKTAGGLGARVRWRGNSAVADV